MFFRIKAPPRAPKYKNPNAECGTLSAKIKATLQPWRPGLEMTFYNSRNFYSDGTQWKSSPSSTPWLESEPADFVEYESWMVLKKPDPRTIWVGWSNSWNGKQGEVRASRFLIHGDDIYPCERRRKGVLCFRTSRFQEAGELFKDGLLEGISWNGDYLDICFKESPSDDLLAKVGWKRLPNGDAIDTHIPLGRQVLEADLVFPGHDPSTWNGISNVSVDCSGEEGCVPSSFSIDNPDEADRLCGGLGRLPKGCRVSVEKQWHWSTRVGCKGVWVEFPTIHCPPIKKSTEDVALKIDRSGRRRKSFLVRIEDLDFSKSFRPVIGVFHGHKGEEKCLITARCDFLKQGSVATRERLTHLITDRCYRVISPAQKGGVISKQKMYGAARLKRLPKNNPQELERLTSLYGDVVPFNYYDYRESELAKMAESRDQALAKGYFDWDDAAKKSIVPEGVFRHLSRKGVVEEIKLYEGRFLYKPLAAKDLSSSPQICREIIEFAAKNEMDWICQLCVQHPAQFKRAIVEATFSK